MYSGMVYTKSQWNMFALNMEWNLLKIIKFVVVFWVRCGVGNNKKMVLYLYHVYARLKDSYGFKTKKNLCHYFNYWPKYIKSLATSPISDFIALDKPFRCSFLVNFCKAKGLSIDK